MTRGEILKRLAPTSVLLALNCCGCASNQPVPAVTVTVTATPAAASSPSVATAAPSATPAPTPPIATASPSTQETSDADFRKLFDEGHDAVISRDYERGIPLLLKAQKLKP